GVEFLFSCIAFSVGLGNVWRFSFIALEIGGGAFLIPYVILLLLGRPVYYLEVIIGQYSGRGCIKAFDMVAIMKDRLAQGAQAKLLIFYYACVMALTIRYLVASFSEVLPWTYCLVEWGSSCMATGDTNDTSIGRTKVLREPETLEDNGLGTPSWDLVLFLIAIGTILSKGTRSSGKASYILALFP
ncbi:hypothetical protein M5D96_014219, partial [Drosophila gunungcola]